MKIRMKISKIIIALGCAALLMQGCLATFGPVVKTEYIVLRPGKPMVVLENVKVLCKPLKGSGQPTKIDIGGWVCLPGAHYDVLWEKAKESIGSATNAN